MRAHFLFALVAMAAGAAPAEVAPPGTFVMHEPASVSRPAPRPVPEGGRLPRARWEHRAEGALWTRVALAAVTTHGAALIATVPGDIAEWCPAYPVNGAGDRAAFWAGLLSALSRHESHWRPQAVGGGGRWFGLLQIFPPTAAFHDCRAETGEDLKAAPANLNCAVRIMAGTVPRDGAIAGLDTRWRGVAADWGPVRDEGKRRDMQRYTLRQSYCRPLSEVRPRPRP